VLKTASDLPVPHFQSSLASEPQLRYDTIFSSDVVAVICVCCRPNERGCGAPEAAVGHHVVIPHHGVFVKHIGRTQVVANPATVVFFTEGREYSVSHPVGDGDDCTSLRFAPSVLQEALAGFGKTSKVRDDAPFDSLGAAVAPAPRDLLAARKLRRLSSSYTSALGVEETALGLLQALTGTAPLRRLDNDSRARRWAVDVEVMLASRPGHRWTLAQVGREVGVSPYHLARRFRAVTGSSIHRRLVAIRLAVAAERILDGENDLSMLALDLGFASHAHLTTAFRAAHGLPPSALRGDALRVSA
jgi:AraC-like DNA-binding protein